MKKKKRIYDRGKSILHIKNSGGGFCKVQKKGRLGKNCVYFTDDGRCEWDGKWCQNSSVCPLYKKQTINVKRN